MEPGLRAAWGACQSLSPAKAQGAGAALAGVLDPQRPGVRAGAVNYGTGRHVAGRRNANKETGKGEGVSHYSPTLEGNPGWGRFPAGGVLPPVAAQDPYQRRGRTGLLSRGEARC